MAQVLGLPSGSWETQIEFQIPDYRVDQPCLLQAFKNQQLQDLYLLFHFSEKKKKEYFFIWENEQTSQNSYYQKTLRL